MERHLLLASVILLSAFAGCSGQAAQAVPPRDKGDGPQNLTKLHEKEAWDGRVSGVPVPYFGYFLAYLCDRGVDPCVGEDAEHGVYVWSDAVNKVLINVTWKPAPEGTERLAVAVKMYDWSKWPADPEEEIQYEEGTSPIQVELKGNDVKWKQFTVTVELPPDSGFVQNQPFHGEVTQWEER